MIEPGPILALLARLQTQVLQLEAQMAERDSQLRALLEEQTRLSEQDAT